jgi:uncharacterized surface protein with fasciclin (FAS1) repeats
MKIHSTTLSARALGLESTIASADDIVDSAVAGKFDTLVAAVKAAFEKLPAGTLESWLQPENKARLRSILPYHVVPGRVMAEEVVNNAHVTNSTTSNGVIQAIGTVLLPKQGRPCIC